MKEDEAFPSYTNESGGILPLANDEVIHLETSSGTDKS